MIEYYGDSEELSYPLDSGGYMHFFNLYSTIENLITGYFLGILVVLVTLMASLVFGVIARVFINYKKRNDS